MTDLEKPRKRPAKPKPVAKVRAGSGDDWPFHFLMLCLISIIVLVAGIYLILNHSSPVEDKRWGCGVVGMILGFWFKGT
jgi:hypothetical protein